MPALSTRVYVVVSDPEIRAAITGPLQSAGFRLNFFASGKEFLALADVCQPGCLIYHFGMTDVGGLELMTQLGRNILTFPVVFIATNGNVRSARKALKSGAVDFIPTPIDPSDLVAAVHEANVQLHKIEAKEFTRTAVERLATLSGREREVLERVVAGTPNKTIALQLKISPRTVEFHRTRIMSKMQAENVPQLVQTAIAAGVAIRRATNKSK